MIFKYLDLEGMKYLCKIYLNGDYYKGIKINSENFNELYNLLLKVYKNKINNFYGIDYKAKEYLKNFLQIKDAIENARMDVSKTIYDMENKMKIDNKVKDNYKIFTCFDTEQAKQYVDTKGYFVNDVDEYRCLDDCYYGTLNVVDNNSSRPYLNRDVPRYFGFFLPEEFVKQKQAKKKYRPYKDIKEFCNQGFQIVVMRHKETKTEFHVLYNGYRLPKGGLCRVILGNLSYSLKDLFDDYEILDSDGIWKPFGIEE